MPATARRRAQRGATTLTELIVVVLMLGLITAAATASFIATQATIDSTDNRIENLGEAQKVMKSVTRDIRTAISVAGTDKAAFTVANPNEIEFHASINTSATERAPSRIRVFVDSVLDPVAPVLVTTVQRPNNPVPDAVDQQPVYGAAPVTRRYVGRYVANSTAKPIFSFYDRFGTLIVPVGTAVIAPADRRKIAIVKVDFLIRRTSSRKHEPVAVQNAVRLPNIIYTQTSTQTNPTP